LWKNVNDWFGLSLNLDDFAQGRHDLTAMGIEQMHFSAEDLDRRSQGRRRAQHWR
jgi:hypothetical protein